MTQATNGARRYFTRTAILRFRPRAISTRPCGTAPPPAASEPGDAPRPGLPAAPSRQPASRSYSRGRPGCRRAGSLSSCRRGDTTQDAVDESPGLVARKCFGQLDRFVDRGFGRHLAIDRDLIDRDAKDDAVHLRHLVELPVLGGLAEDRVELLLVRQHSADELAREVGDILSGRTFRRVVPQHFFHVVVAALELKEDLERQLPCLVALPHSFPTWRRRRSIRRHSPRRPPGPACALSPPRRWPVRQRLRRRAWPPTRR